MRILANWPSIASVQPPAAETYPARPNLTKYIFKAKSRLKVACYTMIEGISIFFHLVLYQILLKCVPFSFVENLLDKIFVESSKNEYYFLLLQIRIPIPTKQC